MMMAPRSLQFASFTLDLDRLCLFGPGGRADLRPKSFEVLRYLVHHAGRVVGKEEVIKAVWPDVTVTDESLTRCISEVRRALGDGSQRIIKTVSRRGYLFDVPISAGNVTAVPAREAIESSVAGNFVRSADDVSRRKVQGSVGRYAAGLHDASDIPILMRAGVAHTILQFDRFALDLMRGCLRADGQDIELPPKAFEVLRHLAENAGRLVPKHELHEAVWPKVVVSDDSLIQCIRELRKKLGDDQHHLIKMVPRRGYLLDATLTTTTRVSDNNVAARRQAAIGIAERPSIAVLPFTDMSDDPDHEHFAVGMAEDIITALSRCNWLSVIVRDSSSTNSGKSSDGRRIGRQPRIDYVLEGTVKRAGNRLRVTVQLVDAPSGVQIWADRFDGHSDEIFGLQDRVTESVVAAIEPRLENAELKRLKHKSIDDLDAYELVLRAHRLENEFTEENYAEAIHCLKQAMAIDPSCAPAMAMASFCYTERRSQGWSTNPEEDADEGLRLANRALEIGQHDPRVLSMGSIAVRSLAGDTQRGWELAARSLELNPNSTMALGRAAWAELFAGSPVKALELARRAQRLSPRDPKAWYTAVVAGRACFATAQYEEAARWTQRSLAQNPRYAPSLRTLAASLARLGRMDDAAQVIQRLLKEDPHLTVTEQRRLWKHMHESVSNPLLEALRMASLPR
jgi:DNA-binding winged helix-turn-helix (wHTH) protein/tetratricopeptide (TPR) repeat protein